MRFLGSVSTLTVAVATMGVATMGVAGMGMGAALAQNAAPVPNVTPSGANVLNLLGPYLSLNATSDGQATLRNNLDQSVAINNGADRTRQSLAISDKSLLGSATNNLSGVGLGTYGAGANLAGGLPPQTPVNGITPVQPVGGLGPQLGALYVQGSSSGNAGPLGSVTGLLSSAYGATGNDLGFAKNYFANGAATNPSTTPPGYVPVPAVAPPGYTLPTYNGLPNPRDSVYDLAYGVRNTDPGQDVYGSSRPVQVAPNRINQFDPSALNGLATNPSFPSGHSTYAFTQGTLFAMLVPQEYRSMLLRSAEYADSRIALGVHYPLDIIGARALSYYDLAQLFTNPLYQNNAATTGTAINLPALFTPAQTQLQAYLSAGCGASVAACAAGPANTTNNPYLPSAANAALYQSRLTYGLPTLSFAAAPREAAPAGGPDASILLAPLYGGSTATSAQIAPGGGLVASLRSETINQILVNTETNALAAFAGTPLSYWTRLDLYAAAGYFDNVVGALQLGATERVNQGVTIGSTGALFANGTILGTVTVGAGGLLGGSGTVGGLAALAGGAVAPGNSIGVLNVAGNVSFAPGSVYQVEANAAGQSDRIAATGTATLGGGTVQVLAANGNYAARTLYPILNANGGVTGAFSGVTSNLAFLTPSLRYGANEVDLTLTRNDVPFAAIAQTRNQAAVAGGIQAAGPGSAIYARTVGLTTPEAVGAFQALSGDIHASSVSTSYETAFFVREAILDRMRWGTPAGSDYGALPAAYTADLPGRRAPAAPLPARVIDTQVFGLWGQGFGAFGQARTDGNAATIDRDLAGFVIGGDARLGDGLRVGAAGGYTSAHLETPNRLQAGTIESPFGAVYGAYEAGPVSLRAGAVYADDGLRTRRAVTFAGFSEGENARYGGSTVQGFGELGYRILLGGAVGPGAGTGLVAKGPLPAPVPAVLTYVEPFVGGAYVSIARDRFGEFGGAAALTGLARAQDIPTFTAGVRAQTGFDLGLGAPLTLHGLLGYRRAFGDVVPTALLAFGAAPGFVTAGIPISRDALIAQAGIDLRVSAQATIGVAYTGQVGSSRGTSSSEDHAVKGTFTYRF